MSFEHRLASIRARGADTDDIAELARLALAEGEEERALPLVEAAAQKASDAQLWQWTGLLQRALDEHEAACRSLAAATRLAPADASIAHGQAHVALEAGIDALPLFDRARRLAPGNAEVLIGQSAARMAAGRGDEAATEIEAILAQVPLWIAGHVQLAQLKSMLGQPHEATLSVESALAALPADTGLWRCLFDLHIGREDYSALDSALDRARGQIGTEPLWTVYRAIAAGELGEAERADALFDAAASEPALAVWHIRHLLRNRRIEEAVSLIDRELATERAAAIWPYASIAWRLANDSRSAWLEGDPRLVSVVDLDSAMPTLGQLAGRLRSLHVAKGEYLDQSVRGGTQTDGPLLSRIDPEIRAIRREIVSAVKSYIAQLPSMDARHPLLGQRRDRRIRFAGSWSVRLRGAGYHANHVHPQGWISSALYVALPPVGSDGNRDAGKLVLGEPQGALGVDLSPTRIVEPREARLVLFPSWMWHGTRPFAEGERLTMAFDVAPPR